MTAAETLATYLQPGVVTLGVRTMDDARRVSQSPDTRAAFRAVVAAADFRTSREMSAGMVILKDPLPSEHVLVDILDTQDRGETSRLTATLAVGRALVRRGNGLTSR